MILAGRALESLGALDGWRLVVEDGEGARGVVASGAELADLAAPFVPQRTPAEALTMTRLHAAIRRERQTRR